MSIDDQIKSAARELALRRNVYKGFVARGKMKQAKADHEIAAMEAIIESLKLFRAFEQTASFLTLASLRLNYEQAEKAQANPEGQ